MTAKEKIQTWKWRIAKAGYNQSTFSEKFGYERKTVNSYVNGKINPSLKTFDEIEGILQELGV